MGGKKLGSSGVCWTRPHVQVESECGCVGQEGLCTQAMSVKDDDLSKAVLTIMQIHESKCGIVRFATVQCTKESEHLEKVKMKGQNEPLQRSFDSNHILRHVLPITRQGQRGGVRPL